MELEAEGTDFRDRGGSRMAEGAAGCCVLWARRVQMWVWASGVCARFPWCPVCMLVPVLWVVSCVVHGRVVESSWLPGAVIYQGEVHVSSRTCESDSWGH